MKSFDLQNAINATLEHHKEVSECAIALAHREIKMQTLILLLSGDNSHLEIRTRDGYQVDFHLSRLHVEGYGDTLLEALEDCYVELKKTLDSEKGGFMVIRSHIRDYERESCKNTN